MKVPCIRFTLPTVIICRGVFRLCDWLSLLFVMEALDTLFCQESNPMSVPIKTVLCWNFSQHCALIRHTNFSNIRNVSAVETSLSPKMWIDLASCHTNIAFETAFLTYNPQIHHLDKGCITALNNWRMLKKMCVLPNKQDCLSGCDSSMEILWQCMVSGTVWKTVYVITEAPDISFLGFPGKLEKRSSFIPQR